MKLEAKPLPPCPQLQYRDAYSAENGPGIFLTVEQAQQWLLALKGLSERTCRFDPKAAAKAAGEGTL